MAQWATTPDVLDRWVGSGQPTDLDQVAQLIDDAEALILAEFPTLPERVASGAVAAHAVKLVIVGMVTRVYRNPEGVRQKQKTIGSFADQVTYAADSISGGMELTPTDRTRLGGIRRAFTINTTPPQPPRAPEWWP